MALLDVLGSDAPHIARGERGVGADRRQAKHAGWRGGL
jgi:hypothetical protein